MVIPAHRIKEKIKWTYISILGCQICLKLVHEFWKRFLNVTNVFLLFLYDHSLIKGVAPHLEKKAWFSFTQGCFMSSLVENGSGISVFSLFLYCLPLKKGGHTTSIKQKGHTLLYTKFGRNLSSGHEEDFQITSMFFYSFFRYYIPFEMSLVFHLNKLEFSTPKDSLFQILFNFAK